jgi:hypothetical protein
MNSAERNALAALAPPDDLAFQQAITTLGSIAPPPADSPTPAVTVQQISVQIQDSAPVFPLNLDALGQQIGFPSLPNFFAVDSGKLIAQGQFDHLDVPPDLLAARVGAVLTSSNPFHLFAGAFTSMLQDLGNLSVAIDYSGAQTIAVAAPLTTDEASRLRITFDSPDKPVIDALVGDLSDRQKLTAVHDGWFVETAVSQVPSSLPVPFDAPDPTSCALVWKGPLPSGGVTLDGDDGFKAALGALKDAAAGQFSFAQAPLGLDQSPAVLQGHVTFTPAGGPFTALTWNSRRQSSAAPLYLTDDIVTALRHWAQIPDFAKAVNDLVQFADTNTLTETLSPEIPSATQGRLQITGTQLALLNAVAGDATALQTMIDPLPEGDSLKAGLNQLKAAIPAAPATAAPVLAVSGAFSPRPAQADLPSLISSQLTITSTSITWTGRVHDARQVDALRALPGDAPFRSAITIIADQLDNFTHQVSFAAAIPARPSQDSLPAALRDNLLIGRFRLRYHGIISEAELTDIRGRFTSKTQPDKDALTRLYSDSLENSKQKRGLSIRARRASAAPGAPAPVQPKAVSIN